ncbi:MAG: indolepyruvate oxidoreductase [Methylibium sp. NZG]|nr:MAG: indolepyruvate oxidoreductase [Methylibium sp. NZG]
MTVLVCALGGEGGGVLAEWLVEVALHCGHSAQSTSIPGVAQRTGATTYYIEVFPQPDSALNGRKPVFSLYPVPGALDLLVSSELLETVRQIGNGMAHAERTQVISSTSRMLTTAEKMGQGDGRVSAPDLLQVLHTHSRESQVFDMAALAQKNGTVMSAVLMGAIAASGALPFAREAYEHVIRQAGLGVEGSLRGFAQAYLQVRSARDAQAAVQAALAPSAAAEATSLPAELLQEFPPATHQMVSLGHARVTEYQDAAYARLYTERLRKVLAAEQAGDPTAAPDRATTRETARWLALWMAFDDIVRVADLKCRTSRIARVRSEVKADEGELLHLYDHFKPGVPEFAALLPQRWADALIRWDRRRSLIGKPPLALPLKIGTHTVLGFAALRLLAACKGLRRRGSRFTAEQRMIERWLACVEQGAREHPALGLALAECGRLIKGYGTTNERGKENLLHVLDHLAAQASFDTPEQRAAAIRAALQAALADEGGKALDKALLAHGAPSRPVKEQPIRWVRTRPARTPGSS